MVDVKMSATGKYRVDIHSQGIDKAGNLYYAAIVMEKVRSYFQPIKQSIYLTQKEIDEYLLQ